MASSRDDDHASILALLPLRDVRSVVFFKRDEITTDLICCDVEVAGRVWTFHEEAPVWSDLIAHLSALPGFKAGWYEAVVSPPFATAETITYDRRYSPDEYRVEGSRAAVPRLHIHQRRLFDRIDLPHAN